MKPDGSVTENELEGFITGCIDNNLSVDETNNLINLWTSTEEQCT